MLKFRKTFLLPIPNDQRHLEFVRFVFAFFLSQNVIGSWNKCKDRNCRFLSMLRTRRQDCTACSVERVFGDCIYWRRQSIMAKCKVVRIAVISRRISVASKCNAARCIMCCAEISRYIFNVRLSNIAPPFCLYRIRMHWCFCLFLGTVEMNYGFVQKADTRTHCDKH